MFGAIAGDVIGSVYELFNVKTTNFQLFNRFSSFTDDTVLTVAIADAILCRKANPNPILGARDIEKSYAYKLHEFGHKYPDAGYGGSFIVWLNTKSMKPYGSCGNGSAMRVSPVGFAFDSLKEVLIEAKRSASVTHNHPEGIKGAQAVASAVFLARTGKSKPEIKDYLEQSFGYNLRQSLDEIRPSYTFNATCQGSVPQAIIAFLESESYEDAIRKAISIGGDSDTIACITGGIAQAYYREIPPRIKNGVRLLLDQEFKKVIDEFDARYQLVY